MRLRRSFRIGRERQRKKSAPRITSELKDVKSVFRDSMLARIFHRIWSLTASGILIVSCTGPALSGCPNVALILSETVEYCPNCREHSMEGWAPKLQIWNVSERAIVVTGIRLFDRDGRPFTDPEDFYLTAFDQRLVSGSPRWRVDSRNEDPEWVRRGAYLREDRLIIPPGAAPAWRPLLGWNFEVEQMARFNVFAGYDGERRLCRFITRPFVIQPRSNSDSATLTFVDERAQ